MGSLRNQIGVCRKAQWTLGAAIACGLGAFFMAGYRPTSAKLHDLDSQIERSERDLMENQRKSMNLPALAKTVDELKRDVEHNGKKLPQDPNLGPFIKSITEYGQGAQLTKFQVQPAAPIRGDLFTAQPISMSFEGNFNNAMAFLREIEDLPRLARVKGLTVRNRDKATGYVEVEVKMDIYFAEG